MAIVLERPPKQNASPREWELWWEKLWRYVRQIETINGSLDTLETSLDALEERVDEVETTVWS